MSYAIVYSSKTGNTEKLARRGRKETLDGKTQDQSPHVVGLLRLVKSGE